MRKLRKKRACASSTVVVAVIVGALFVSQAFSDPGYSYTTIASPPAGEPNHADLLQYIYGGIFTKQISPISGKLVDYSNGTITARRAYDVDSLCFTLNLLTQTLDGEVDQIWTDGSAIVTAKAKYASLHQSFGWNKGGTGTVTYEELVSDTDVGQEGVTFYVNGDFLWGYRPDNYHWWSMSSKNSDYKDHFITYKIEGLSDPFYTGRTVWLLFMEDLPCYETDRDYNDFVVEISAIPEPATIMLVAFGTLLIIRRKRNL